MLVESDEKSRDKLHCPVSIRLAVAGLPGRPAGELRRAPLREGAPKRTIRNNRSIVITVSLRDRYASRVILFSRFLRTAPPHPRATTTAMRVVGLPLSRRGASHPEPPHVRGGKAPNVIAPAESFLSRRLFLIRGRELHPSLWRVCASVRAARPWWPFAHESRTFSSFWSCWADTSVSLKNAPC